MLGQEMETQEALGIVRRLADGQHPETGAVLPADSLYRQPRALKALQRAVGALERQHRREKIRTSATPNAGKPWTANEDEQLAEKLRLGMTVQQMAIAHRRGEGSIVARILYLRQKRAATGSQKVAP